ncbi:hypothetical protein GW17_00044121 [Ensete ventricosum]|nr:hypothetical protein GW17_00044121 [Ensete ventricosum]
MISLIALCNFIEGHSSIFIEFTPEVGRYDVIWIQWCIGQLPDDDFLSFFKRAKVGLKPNGFFVVKENTARSVFDYFGFWFQDQKGFPEELFPVKMYALVTDKRRGSNNGRGKTQQHKPAVIKS